MHGIKLKSYKFDKYKSKKDKLNLLINVSGKNKPSLNDQIKFKAIEEGTFYARDLVSEPGNVLHPDEYARRLKILKKNIREHEIIDKALDKLGVAITNTCEQDLEEGTVDHLRHQKTDKASSSAAVDTMAIMKEGETSL